MGFIAVFIGRRERILPVIHRLSRRLIDNFDRIGIAVGAFDQRLCPRDEGEDIMLGYDWTRALNRRAPFFIEIGLNRLPGALHQGRAGVLSFFLDQGDVDVEIAARAEGLTHLAQHANHFFAF